MTRAALAGAGFRALEHGQIADFRAFSVLPLTFKRGYHFDHAAVKRLEQLDWICGAETSSPLIVVAHWGDEYSRKPGRFERSVVDKLANCGVSAIIGSHTHQASRMIRSTTGGALQYVYSLGNLLFDQSAEKADSAIVEMRVFDQGTMAMRLIPVSNLYDNLLQMGVMAPPVSRPQ